MAARLTPLETAVLEALAWDLRDVVPDLAGQVEESWPGQRRNTGFGYFAELIVNRDRPSPGLETHGRFGTVHAMIGDLPEPVAFQVELREGRLLALHADSYGQDTRAIDFTATPFDEIFTVDDAGQSVLFDPVALMPESPLTDIQTHADVLTEPPPYVPPESPLRVLQRSDEAPRASAANTLPGLDLKAALDGPPASANARLITWLIVGALFILGICIGIGGGFDLFALVPVIGGVSLFRVPKLRMALARYVDTLLERRDGDRLR